MRTYLSSHCNHSDRGGTDKNHRWAPMYIFIDELDRCRPTFAIEVLEVIKHIFSIKQIVFVIATDTEQLQHSIKAVYGSGFNSNKYLDRFFDRRFTLSQPNLYSFIKNLSKIDILIERIIDTNKLSIINWDKNLFINFLSSFFECFNFDLRTISQIIERIMSILIIHKNEQAVVWILVLESIRVFDQDLYQLFIKEKIDINRDFINKYFSTSANKGVLIKGISNKRFLINKISPNWKTTKLVGISKIYNLLNKYSQNNNDDIHNDFKNLIGLIGRIYKDNTINYADEHFNSIFNLYIWETKNEDIKRFQKYIEITANLN